MRLQLNAQQKKSYVNLCADLVEVSLANHKLRSISPLCLGAFVANELYVAKLRKIYQWEFFLATKSFKYRLHLKSKM